jgi:hypothetical protein
MDLTKSEISVLIRAENSPEWHVIKIDRSNTFDTTLASAAGALDLNLGSFNLSLVGGGIINNIAVLDEGDKLLATVISPTKSAEQRLNSKDYYLKKKRIIK